MKFFKTLGAAIYDPALYARETTGANKDAWKYFLKLAAVVAVVTTIIVSVIAIPLVVGFFSSKSVDSIVGYFPAELTVTVKDGHASSNVKEPYAIPVSRFVGQLPATSTAPANLAVIDTTHPFSIESFKSYNTALLLTSDYIVSQDKVGKISVQSIANFPNAVVNRTAIVGWVDQLRPMLKVLIPLGVLLLVVGLFIYHVLGGLVQIVIAAFVLWIVMRIRKMSLGYGQLFRLALYGITAPLIVFLVLGFMLHASFPVVVLVEILWMLVLLRGVKPPAPVPNAASTSL